MDTTLALTGFEDFEFPMMPNGWEPDLVASGMQSFEPLAISNDMDLTGTAFGAQVTGFCTVLNEMEPTGKASTIQDTGFSTMLDTVDPTSTASGFQDIGSDTMLHATEPSNTAFITQNTGIYTMSNVMKFTSTNPSLQDTGHPLMSSTIPAGRSKVASKADWIRARPLIKRLYVDENRTLREVMAIVEEEHSFKATLKMYKDRIRNWRFIKNNKEDEMAAILRKKMQRAFIGKRSVFQVRGRGVDLDEVHHYFRRKGTTLEEALARYVRAATPPDIFCWTPPLSPRFGYEVPRSPSTPHSLNVPEQLFFNIDRYMRVSFDNMIWVVAEDGDLVNTTTLRRDRHSLYSFNDYCIISADFAEKKLFVESRRAMSKACSLVQCILTEEHPRTLEYLLHIVLYLIKYNVPEMGTQLVKYISEMSFIITAEHPWSQICKQIGKIEFDRLWETFQQSCECIHKVYVQSLGQFHERSLSFELSMIAYSEENLFSAEQRLRKLLLQCREATGSSSRSSLEVLQDLGWNLIRQEKYVDAESVALDLLNNAREAGDNEYELSGLEFVARAEYGQGKRDMAEMSLREALDLIGRYYEDSDSWGLQIVIRLKSLLNWEFEEMASELQIEIERRMLLCEITDDE